MPPVSSPGYQIVGRVSGGRIDPLDDAAQFRAVRLQPQE
jgi:hypothetical protein